MYILEQVFTQRAIVDVKSEVVQKAELNHHNKPQWKRTSGSSVGESRRASPNMRNPVPPDAAGSVETHQQRLLSTVSCNLSLAMQ